MTGRQLSRIGLAAALLAALAMLLGHLGTDTLSWKSDTISHYAANAPQGELVTASMLLTALMLVVMAILTIRNTVLAPSRLSDLVPILSGAAVAGLLMLSYYQETASSIAALKRSGFWAIRVQSFHDAGLDIFFYSALLLVVLLGLLILRLRARPAIRTTGAFILLLSPLSYLLMSSHWPRMLGISGSSVGLNERAGLFCLWLAAVLFLFVVHGLERQDAGR